MEQTSKQEVSGGLEPEKSEIFEAPSLFLLSLFECCERSFRFEKRNLRLSLDDVCGLEQTSKQEVSGGLEPEKSEIAEAPSLFLLSLFECGERSFRFEKRD